MKMCDDKGSRVMGMGMTGAHITYASVNKVQGEVRYSGGMGLTDLMEG